MLNLATAFRTGLKHRLICAAFPFAAAALVVSIGRGTAEPFLFAQFVAFTIYTILGFCSPIILTEGFNKPFPSSKHLSLLSPHIQKLLLWLSVAVLCMPLLLRLLPKD